jgi:hypothetical protein
MLAGFDAFFLIEILRRFFDGWADVLMGYAA